MRTSNLRRFNLVATACRLGILIVAGATAAGAQLNHYGMQSLQPGVCCAIEVENEIYFGIASAVADFNGDGFGDLAIGAMGAPAPGGEQAGKVVVLRGTANGPTTAGQVVLDEAALGGVPADYDAFGRALAIGDWNLDGADDLAIGVPGDNPDAINSAGGVYVVYGSGGGGNALFRAEVDYWSYATVNLGGFAHEGDNFGRSLATGDYDGDGDDDLAIGVPFDNVYAGNASAGSLTILRGGPFGLSPLGGVTLHRNSAGVPGNVSDLENFGAAIAAGDFDGDGDDELAIGAPGTSLDGVATIGEVVVLELEIDGGDLAAASWKTWSEGHGIPGAQEVDDRYGWSLAVGDFDGDGAEDLAIGAPYEGVGTFLEAGAIAMLYGSVGAGLEANATLRTQGEIPDEDVDQFEEFGAALASGDFDHDGRDELVVGVPANRHLYGGAEWVQSGAVHVIPGGLFGLSFSATQTWTGTPGDPADDGFGGVLATGRLRGPADALFIGSPRWTTGRLDNLGRATVLHSFQIFADGFASSDTFLWSATVP